MLTRICKKDNVYVVKLLSNKYDDHKSISINDKYYFQYVVSFNL